MIHRQPHKTIRSGPEAKGTRLLINYMRAHGWWCKKIHGGKFQSGLPDWYCIDPSYGHKWVEMKAPNGKISSSQIQVFSQMTKYGDKIWICRDEKDYQLLFGPPNWKKYVWQ